MERCKLSFRAGESLIRSLAMEQCKRDALFTTNSCAPGWYHTYFIAVAESDRDKALLEIDDARIAIQERIVELRHLPPSNPCEMQDLCNALTYIGILLMHIGNESGSLLWD